jgi:hypothetical protein
MKKNYADAQFWGGGCLLGPGTALVNYAVTSGQNQKTCEFCHWNNISTAPKCTAAPDWIRLQLGTLDCAHLEQRLAHDPEKIALCMVRDPVQCGTVLRTVFYHWI